jgi:hypothetical protein
MPFGPLELHLWILSNGHNYNSNVWIQVGSQSIQGCFIVPFAIQTSGLHHANEQLSLAMHLVNQGDNPLIVRVVYRSLFGTRMI